MGVGKIALPPHASPHGQREGSEQPMHAAGPLLCSCDVRGLSTVSVQGTPITHQQQTQKSTPSAHNSLATHTCPFKYSATGLPGSLSRPLRLPCSMPAPCSWAATVWAPTRARRAAAHSRKQPLAMPMSRLERRRGPGQVVCKVGSCSCSARCCCCFFGSSARPLHVSPARRRGRDRGQRHGHGNFDGNNNNRGPGLAFAAACVLRRVQPGAHGGRG